MEIKKSSWRLRWVALATLGLWLGSSACSSQRNQSDSGDSDVSQADAREQISPEEALARPRPRRLRPPPELNEKRPPRLISAAHILVQYEGAKRSKTNRSKRDAQKLAKSLLSKAQQEGAHFHSLAAEYSEAPDQRMGGYLGIFPPGKQLPELTDEILSVPEETVIPRVLETETGLHVVRREKTLHIGHVLVMHSDSRFAYRGITRSRDEARREAERLHGLLTADGADFEAIAREHSDCRRSKAVGGDLGFYGRGAVTLGGGRLLPEMINAIKRLEPGQVSDIAETGYGFHVLWRYPDSSEDDDEDRGDS